jgi:hypothetical protein
MSDEPLSADEELAVGTALTSAETLALMLLQTVELAVRFYPDTLRRLLASVFDLGAVEEQARKATATMQKAHTAADQLRARFRRLDKDMERLRNELNQLKEMKR